MYSVNEQPVNSVFCKWTTSHCYIMSHLSQFVINSRSQAYSVNESDFGILFFLMNYRSLAYSAMSRWSLACFVLTWLQWRISILIYKLGYKAVLWNFSHLFYNEITSFWMDYQKLLEDPKPAENIYVNIKDIHILLFFRILR